jgi:GntR family transcriptional repressor for pyruvate dehydrogenase complex
MGVADEAIVKIKEMIVGGELGPGQRLPPERTLSEHLGVSRASLREAVKALEVIRVLDVRRGDGTYVTSLEPRLLHEALSFVVDLHADASILEILAVLRILEPGAAALAASGMTPEAADELRRVTAGGEQGMGVEELIERDLAFHRAIANLSRNSYLASLLDSLSSATVRARIWHWITDQDSVARTLAEQDAIVEAVARGDSVLAPALMTGHLNSLEEALRHTLDSASDPADA